MTDASQHDMGQTLQPEVSLAIPCYNETAVLRTTALRLVQAFSEIRISLELVLVDNGSTDGTGEIIDQLIEDGLPIVKRTIPVNQGYGHGILTGLEACRGRVIGFLHADGQCDARDVAKVCDVALNIRQPTMVKIRRRFRMEGFRRKFTSLLYNIVINILYPGIGSHDVNGSPKVFPREYLAAMDLQSQDWFIDPEMMVRAKTLGLPIMEVNVMWQVRPGGQSNVDASTSIEFIFNLLKYRVRGHQPQTAQEKQPKKTSGDERSMVVDSARSSS